MTFVLYLVCKLFVLFMQLVHYWLLLKIVNLLSMIASEFMEFLNDLLTYIYGELVKFICYALYRGVYERNYKFVPHLCSFNNLWWCLRDLYFVRSYLLVWLFYIFSSSLPVPFNRFWLLVIKGLLAGLWSIMQCILFVWCWISNRWWCFCFWGLLRFMIKRDRQKRTSAAPA